MNPLQIKPNVPLTVSLVNPEGTFDFEGGFGLYETTAGQIFILPRPAVVLLNTLDPDPGEEIVITKHWSGKRGEKAEWTIALSPRSEKCRAKAENEGQDLTEQLQASIEQVQPRKRAVADPTPIRRPSKRAPAPEVQPRLFDRGTGTHGPAPAIQPEDVPRSIPLAGRRHRQKSSSGSDTGERGRKGNSRVRPIGPQYGELGRSGKTGFMLDRVYRIREAEDYRTVGKGERMKALKCNCCGTAMTMRRYENGGGLFTCQCGQQWNFQTSHTTSTILARLYPSKMTDESPLYQEFLDYQLTQYSFQMEASVLCGLLERQEADRKLTAFQTEVATVRREIARRKKSWWQRIVGLWERG